MIIMRKVRKNTKELILESALKLFSTSGYDNTSVKEIARKAGSSHGLLYNYFDSKDQLLKEIFVIGSSSIESSFKELYKPDFGLVRLVLTIFDVFDANEAFWRLRNSLKLQKHLTPIFTREINSTNDLFIGYLSSHLKKDSREDHQLEAQYIFTVIEGISINYLCNKKYPIENIIKKLLISCKSTA